jgi:hypothetical protein
MAIYRGMVIGTPIALALWALANVLVVVVWRLLA